MRKLLRRQKRLLLPPRQYFSSGEKELQKNAEGEAKWGGPRRIVKKKGSVGNVRPVLEDSDQGSDPN